jgi:uncharacterized membrane protein (GlpM family)
MLWLFKIFAVPILVALATLAIRRWGAAIGGLLVGLPFMTGPISYFLALDHGIDFAVGANTGVILAVAAVGPWMIAFYWLAGRFSWPVCMAGGVLAFAAAGLVLQSLRVDGRTAAAIAYASTLIALAVMPRVKAAPVTVPPPRWDLPVRMIVTGVVVVAVTFLAEQLGPQLSGIVATLPIVSGVVACFTLHSMGTAMTRTVLRGVATAMLSFIAFFVVIGESIRVLGIPLAYTAAVLVTLPLSALVATIDRRMALR